VPQREQMIGGCVTCAAQTHRVALFTPDGWPVFECFPCLRKRLGIEEVSGAGSG
jgi:hypothetical protein